MHRVPQWVVLHSGRECRSELPKGKVPYASRRHLSRRLRYVPCWLCVFHRIYDSCTMRARHGDSHGWQGDLHRVPRWQVSRRERCDGMCWLPTWELLPRASDGANSVQCRKLRDDG